MPEETKNQETKGQDKKQTALEKPDNCMKCNKRLQRKTWYYRNNGYYCSKRCWMEAQAAQEKEKAVKKEQAKAKAQEKQEKKEPKPDDKGAAQA